MNFESLCSLTRVLAAIDDYLSAADVFPGVGLKGGVNFFLWDRDNPGECRVSTRFKDWPVSTMTRQLLEEGADVFIRFNEGLSILKEKVASVETGEAKSLLLPEKKRFDRLVSSTRVFGFRTFFKGKTKKSSGDLLIYQNGGTGYVSRDAVTTGTHLIDKWKLFAGSAAPGTGNKDTYPHKIHQYTLHRQARHSLVGDISLHWAILSLKPKLRALCPTFPVGLRAYLYFFINLPNM